MLNRWLLLIALLGGTACYATAPLKPSELARLDGYHDGQPAGGPVYLLSPDDHPVEVAARAEIYLEAPGARYGGTFRSIRVTDGMFDGVTADGAEVRVPLASIQTARVREPNRVAMAPVFVGAALAVILAVGYVYLKSTAPGPTTGRALRVSRRPITARAVHAHGWDVDQAAPAAVPVTPAAREALARLWTEAARGEHASVPAFSRLSLSLVALGAPARLVAAAHRAALDEIEHARLAFSLASTYAGVVVGPAPLPELATAPAVTATSLADLATESLIDGCLLEGAAAEVARRALIRARDPEARAALAIIARDEAAHAELAWDVVRWCRQQGGGVVQGRLAAALERTPPSVNAPRIPPALGDVLADHGWLGDADWREAARVTWAVVSARASALS